MEEERPEQLPGRQADTGSMLADEGWRGKGREQSGHGTGPSL